MKLVKQKSANSFFESFSDLIFATMAIFVMLLIIFISQNESSQPKLEYTGSSATTYSLISHIFVDNVPSVLFFPVDVADSLSLHRQLGLNDPLLKLSQIAVSEDGLVTMPMTEYVKMASGISREFAMVIRSQGEGTIEAALLVEARAENTGNQVSETIKKEVFGETTLRVLTSGPGENRVGLAEKWRRRYMSISSWLQSQANGNFHSWISQSREPLRANALPDNNGRPIVTYRITSGRDVQIGDAILSLKQFKAFLTSIHAGATFALVHMSANNTPAVPPQWFLDDVLVPTGYGATR